MPKMSERSKRKRLEQEVIVLRHEVATLRCERDEMNQKHAAHLKRCEGGDNCRLFHFEAKKQAQVMENQNLYIGYLELQIGKTRNKYQKMVGEFKSCVDKLGTELEKLRGELQTISLKAEHVDKLQKKLQSMRLKMRRRDGIIARYDAQHSEIMGIISSLQDRIANEAERQTAAAQPQQNVPTSMDEQVTSVADETTEMPSSSDVDRRDGDYFDNTPFNFHNLTTALKKSMEPVKEAEISTDDSDTPN